MKRKRNHTSFSLPKPLSLWVDQQAKKAGKSRSGWIVWLLEREQDLKLTIRMSELEKRVDYIERPFKDLPTNIRNR